MHILIAPCMPSPPLNTNPELCRVGLEGKELNPDTAKAVQQRVLAGSKGADGRAATQLRPEQMKVRDCILAKRDTGDRVLV